MELKINETVAIEFLDEFGERCHVVGANGGATWVGIWESHGIVTIGDDLDDLLDYVKAHAETIVEFDPVVLTNNNQGRLGKTLLNNESLFDLFACCDYAMVGWLIACYINGKTGIALAPGLDCAEWDDEECVWWDTMRLVKNRKESE